MVRARSCSCRPHDTGGLVPMRRKRTPPLERFTQYLSFPPCGCWIWTGALRKHNGVLYGQFHEGRDEDGRPLVPPAHRYLFQVINGALSGCLVLDHLCRTPTCVNPDHLDPVSQRINVQRGNAVKTHCPQGHPYSGANLAVWKEGRRCRSCRSTQKKVVYAQRLKLRPTG